jgi:hypothetical protein
MNSEDLWNECDNYLRHEGWGDLVFLKADNPAEYQSVRKFFGAMETKFRSSPEEFKGAGAFKGLGNLPPIIGTFLMPYQAAQLYEPGDPYRRYLLAKGINEFLEEIKGGKGRQRSETDRMASELLYVPRSELLRQEKMHRPDGADTAVSRAGKKFRTSVMDSWRNFSGLSPWALGIIQFFFWKVGNENEEESKLADQIASDVAKEFNEGFKKAQEELKKYGPPSPEEMRNWYWKNYDKLKQEIVLNPRLKPLLIPLILERSEKDDA